MTVKEWKSNTSAAEGDVITGGAVPPGSTGDSPWDAVAITTDGTAKYSTLNPPFAGWRSMRLQATAGKVQPYQILGPDSSTGTPQFAHRYYVRVRMDQPINTLICVTNTSFATVMDVRLDTISSQRHISCFLGSTRKQDFGLAPFGTSVNEILLVEMGAVKGGAGVGQLRCRITDRVGTVLATYVDTTTVDTGALNFLRIRPGGNTGVIQDIDIWGHKQDDSQSGFLGGYSPPVAPPTMVVTTYADCVVLAAASAPGVGSGDTGVTHSAGNNGGMTITELVDANGQALYICPRQAPAASDYQVTITPTSTPSNQLGTPQVFTIPKQTIGGTVNVRAPKIHTGSLPGSTWA
jgi:hypothetical protein